jgi:thymidylate synthase (FAD)
MTSARLIWVTPKLLRHDFNFQEFSQRYSEVMSIEPIELRRQDHKNRQNSIDDLPRNVSESLSRDIDDLMVQTKSLYQKLLSNGVAKECGRMFVPMASSTRLYASANVRDWCHYLKLRTGNGTQKEHVQVAEAIMPIFSENFPLTTRAFFD